MWFTRVILFGDGCWYPGQPEALRPAGAYPSQSLGGEYHSEPRDLYQMMRLAGGQNSEPIYSHLDENLNINLVIK